MEEWEEWEDIPENIRDLAMAAILKALQQVRDETAKDFDTTLKKAIDAKDKEIEKLKKKMKIILQNQLDSI